MDVGRVELPSLDVESALLERGSVRSFLPKPVDRAILRKVFDLARWAPSNCNSQPWLVKLVSGAARDRMERALLADVAAGRASSDFTFDRSVFTGFYRERMLRQNETLARARGGSSGDPEAGRRTMEDNARFFGAPHEAFFFMPAWGNERQASDIGMFAQSVMLAFMSHGIATCPQTSLSFYAETVRRELGVGADHKLLYGMAIGYPDRSNPAYRYDQGRAPLEEFVDFIES